MIQMVKKKPRTQNELKDKVIRNGFISSMIWINKIRLNGLQEFVDLLSGNDSKITKISASIGAKYCSFANVALWYDNDFLLLLES